MLTLRWTAWAVLALGGCVSAPAPPPVSTPIGDMEDRGSIVAVGVEMPRFYGSYTVDGREVGVSPAPRLQIFALQLVVLEKRWSLSERCDLGAHLLIGRLGADVRCGLGSETSGVAVGSGLSWVWARGVEGETTVQAGFEDEGFLLYLSTGLGYSANYGWTLGLDEPGFADLADVLYRPTDGRLLVIQQLDLGWVATLAWGIPFDRHTSYFMGYRFRYPFVTSEASFNCINCDGTEGEFSDFYPGWEIGVVIGFRGAGF